MTFVKMYSENDNKCYWMLKITSFEDFLKYHDHVIARSAKAWGKIHDSLSRPNGHCPWCTESLEKSFWLLAYCKLLLKESLSIQEYSIVMVETLKIKLDILYEHGVIYVNENGGFFHINPYLREVDTMEQIDMIFPTTKNEKLLIVQISKWKAGNHYYVVIENNQMKLDDENKWNLYSDALNAVDRYMKKEFPGRKYKVERKLSTV